MRNIRVALVDDRRMICDALSVLLAREGDMTIVAQCPSVADAVSVLAHNVTDIVLVDLDMTQLKADRLAGLAGAFGFLGRVIVLTSATDGTDLLALLADGAAGIVSKRNPGAQLAPIIRRVAAGETWVDPLLTRRPDETGCGEQLRSLTGREHAVLAGVLNGLSNKEIAADIRTTDNAVKSALRQIFSKVGVQSRTQLIRVVMDYLAGRRAAPAASERWYETAQPKPIGPQSAVTQNTAEGESESVRQLKASSMRN